MIDLYDSRTNMRLMLGNTCPELLVNVIGKFKEYYFKFWVVNGAWEGEFRNGDIILSNQHPEYVVAHHKILCSNQDRLSGEYQTVFDSFDDSSYVAPVKKVVEIDDYDNDIPL